MPLQRIVIIGPSGSGKSTLARRIGKSLGLPVVHLDRFNWNPGWVQTDRSVFREKVAEAVKGDAWVMEGNYTRSTPIELRLARAHAIVWLDLPRHVYFPRAVWRCLRHYGRAREDIGPGCPERIDLPFLTNWVWTYAAHSRPEHAAIMAALPADLRGITLRSHAEVAQFTNALPHSLTNG
jgi:adenylate kinase family enzyme